MRKELTATEIKSIKREGIYRAGPTLYLRIAPGGSKSWVQRLIYFPKRSVAQERGEGQEHGLEISTAFWFNYAHVSQEAGLYDQADLTTRYLNEAGNQGEYYMEALRVLDAAELAHKRQEAEEKWDNLPVSWSASPAAPSTWGI